MKLETYIPYWLVAFTYLFIVLTCVESGRHALAGLWVLNLLLTLWQWFRAWRSNRAVERARAKMGVSGVGWEQLP